MARYCPLTKTVVTYIVCTECEEKICRRDDKKSEKAQKNTSKSNYKNS